MLSAIIPARNEPFLRQTIDGLLANAAGEIEVIAVLDGYWPEDILTDPRVRYLHRGQALGMRAALNAAARVARGEFLLKTDGHCMFGPGYDEILAADCDEDWVVVPRRKRLDADNWTVIEDGRPDIDYMYLSPDLHGKLWEERNRDPALKDVLVDDLMSAQGSGWFMPRAYYERLELLDESAYGPFWSEFQEIGLKCWLSGGRVAVNKGTWYAHLHKKSRGYNLDAARPEEQLQRWLTGEGWQGQTLPFSSLLERFWPVPDWPERAEWPT